MLKDLDDFLIAKHYNKQGTEKLLRFFETSKFKKSRDKNPQHGNIPVNILFQSLQSEMASSIDRLQSVDKTSDNTSWKNL